ncbi:MAG: SulP family inorganic anion transporter [Burkholderiales bacterium]|nr:SulP family inorganic anion transporter [Burkholderiales bacterium]
MAEAAPPAGSESHWSDLAAGLCVAGILLPEAVAYAGLAHLPAVHALSAAMVGLLVYFLLGGSRFAAVAPTSSTAVLLAAAVATVPGISGGAAIAQATAALVMMAGALLLLLAWAGQGQLSAFVSRPVLRGFAFALAVTIVAKQLPDALRLELAPGAGSNPVRLLAYAFGHVGSWHLPSLGIALVAGALVALLRRWPRLPASMIVLVLSIAASRWLDLPAWGVATVGRFDRPVWRLALPDLALGDWMRLGELAFGLVVLVFAESWGSIRSLALARGDSVDANRELRALGACNLAAGLFNGMAVGAGFSATSASAAAGATSRWAGLVALVVFALALQFALPALELLPRAVLAVAVISALWHALSPRPLVQVWRMGRDRGLLVGAIAAVLYFGVLDGMLMSIALSIVAALRRFSQPVVHELGELDSTRNYIVIESHEGACAAPGLIVLRPEEPLFFASAESVGAEVLRRAAERGGVHGVVLSLEESADLDSTAAECLLELDQRLHAAGRRLVLARVKDPARELLGRLAPQGLGSPQRLFWSVADAAASFRADPGPPPPVI